VALSRRRGWGLAAAIAVAVVILSGARPTAAPPQQSRQPAGDVVLGPAPGDDRVRFTLALHQPGASALAAALADIADPASPQYRQFIDATTFGTRFGLRDGELQRVREWVGRAGLELVSDPPQRTTLGIAGSVARVEAALGVNLVNVRDGRTGIVFHRPSREARVPRALGGLVDAVADLSNRPAVGPPASRALVEGALRPTDLIAAYDIQAMHAAGLEGDGVFVGVVSFFCHLDSDIAAYENAFDLEAPTDGPALTNIGGPPGSCRDRLEPSGDIEVVRAVAPHARILNFEGTYTVSQSDVIDAIVADGRAKIVTDSYGVCWPDASSADRAAGLKSLEAAWMHGITVFVASGDWGAYDCYNSGRERHEISVDWPSSTQYTISVGGTRLDVRTDGAYFEEVAWAEYFGVGGSGGGLNADVPRPDWQHGPGVDNGFSNGFRQVPDVAAAAAGDSAYAIYVTQPDDSSGRFHLAAGTSFASPLWAGVTALLQQHVEAEGLNWPGFIGPMLYDIAATSPAAFHDITKGNNLFYPATPGWDYATGIGSPDLAVLDQAVLEYLR
jgi:subtilase family serine protease